MKKKIVIVFVVLIVLIILLKIVLGQIDIKMKIPYNNPIYRLQLNDNYYGMNMEINYNVNIIPKNLTFIKTAHLFTSPSEAKIKLGEKISLNIIGYNCFSNIGNKEKQIGCTNYNHKIMKEIKDIKFSKMKITGGSEVGLVNDLIYDGEFTNELTNLITKKGEYQIEIILEHKPISSNLFFIIEVE